MSMENIEEKNINVYRICETKKTAAVEETTHTMVNQA